MSTGKKELSIKDKWKRAEEPYNILIEGKKPKIINSWNDLGYHMAKLQVTPQEAFRIIRERKTKDTSRFNWKMVRFTLFIWERVREDAKGYLKPKIDTVKSVVADERFKELMYGYYPELPFEYEHEVTLLNRLIAETIQRPYFTEGYYVYEKTKGIIPQKHLDRILWTGKNK